VFRHSFLQFRIKACLEQLGATVEPSVIGDASQALVAI
jgi:hypothetical protein